MGRHKKEKVRRILDDLARAKGEDRRRHFAAGGSVSDWRGAHSVVPDARKENARKKCRGKVDSD